MTALTNCPLCNYPGIKQHQRGSFDMYLMECERCGTYIISYEVLIFSDIKAEFGKAGYILSGLTRELQETGGERPTFLTTNLETQLKHHLVPNVGRIEEKIQKLLLRLREKTEYFGQEINLGDIELAIPLAYAKNSRELQALLSLISEKNLARVGYTEPAKFVGTTDMAPAIRSVKITLLEAGWDLTNSYQKQNTDSDRGFIAVWFDESMNESIVAAEQAISENGFRPVCIRDEHFSEKIMDKALGEIRQSRFVVIDLTGARASVFFEAGFAHGLGIDSIYVYRENENQDKTPLDFYVRHYQCYKYKDSDDLREILKAAISARIKISK